MAEKQIKFTTPGSVRNVTVQGGEIELEIDNDDLCSVKSFLDDWVRLTNEEWCKRPKGEHHFIHPVWDEILTPEDRRKVEEKLGAPLENFKFYPEGNEEEAGGPCDLTITLGYDREGVDVIQPSTNFVDFPDVDNVNPGSLLRGDFIVPVQPMSASRIDHYHGPVRIKVKKLNPKAKMPLKKSGQEENFCFDVFAIEKKEIAPGTFEYRTGLAFEIEDHELKEKYILSIDARPRSSVSETGLVLCNCTGTIDDPYRGEVKARFYQVKEGPEYKPYEPGDRIMQIKIGLTPRCQFIELGENEELSETVRGQGGFGSSGRK